MNYTVELIQSAQALERQLCVEYSNPKYLVSIANVVHKDGYVRRSVYGIGYSIEEACRDYLIKCDGGMLENYITNKVVKIINNRLTRGTGNTLIQAG